MSTATCQDALARFASEYYAAHPGTLEAERKALMACAAIDGTKPKHWKRHGIGKRGDVTIRLFEKEYDSFVLPSNIAITEEKPDGSVSFRWVSSVEQAVLDTGISWNWNGLGSMTTKEKLLNPDPEPAWSASSHERSPWVLVSVPYKPPA